MNRRNLLYSIVGSLPLVAISEIAQAAPKAGVCQPCKNQGTCDHGLTCADGVCGPPSSLCAGRFYRCGARRHLVCQDGRTAVCYHASDRGRHRKAAKPLCP